MRSNLALNTTVGNDRNNRYSYIHTPAEFRQQPFGSDREDGAQSQLSAVPESPPAQVSQPLHNNPSIQSASYQPPPSQRSFSPGIPPVQSPPPTSLRSPPNQSVSTPQVIISSPTSQQSHNHLSGAPRLSQHPANFAPFADDLGNRKQTGYTLPRYPQPAATIPTTNSPGPLPSKRDAAAEAQERREKQLAIVPDNQPLGSQSSASVHTYTPSTATMPGDPAAYHLPGQIKHPTQAQKGGPWRHELYDCRDIGTCCLGFLCPCVLYGRTQYRLSQRSEKKDPTNLLGYELCNASCTMMALLCGCQCLFSTIQHSRVRRAYDIPGSYSDDCVRATCCICCTLIQDEREIKSREEGARQGANNVPGTIDKQYSRPGHMTFGPPPR